MMMNSSTTTTGTSSTTTVSGGTNHPNNNNEQQQQQYQMTMIEFEAKQRAYSINVPTLPQDVKGMLRSLGLPTRLFGENLANVRDRLRMILSTQQVLLGELTPPPPQQIQPQPQPSQPSQPSQPPPPPPPPQHLLSLDQMRTMLITMGGGDLSSTMTMSTESQDVPFWLLQQQQQQQQQRLRFIQKEEEEEHIIKYTRAHPLLIEARKQWTTVSLQRSKLRLQWERTLRKITMERNNHHNHNHNHNDNNHNHNHNQNHNSTNSKKRKLQTQQPKDTLGDADADADAGRSITTPTLLDQMDQDCWKLYQSLSKMTLEGSQYGDTRPLSCIATVTIPTNDNNDNKDNNQVLPSSIIATCGWSGTIQLWNGSSPTLDCIGTKTMAHEDRIMGMALTTTTPTTTTTTTTNNNNNNHNTNNTTHHHQMFMATASIDCTAKLWKITPRQHDNNNDNNDNNQNNTTTAAVSSKSLSKNNNNNNNNNNHNNHNHHHHHHHHHNNNNTNNNNALYTIQQLHHWKGHMARLCRIAFHPMMTNNNNNTLYQQYIGTTSYDHTWRLWDSVTGQQLLLQDGHEGPVYGIHFHHDGSLVATSDATATVHCWDIRCGKSILTLPKVHAQRVLCTKFLQTNTGIPLVTAGDDGTIKVWDVRHCQRSSVVPSIPAHTKLISSIASSSSLSTTTTTTTATSHPSEDEYIATSSFDGTVKLWSTRDWKMIQCLQGHEGRVMCVHPIHIMPTTSNNIVRNRNMKYGLVTCGFDKTFKLWM